MLRVVINFQDYGHLFGICGEIRNKKIILFKSSSHLSLPFIFYSSLKSVIKKVLIGAFFTNRILVHNNPVNGIDTSGQFGDFSIGGLPFKALLYKVS